MALANSPSIVTNGLVFAYDMNSPVSYPGPPGTNLLPNGVNAGYPTSPSGWGTYNTNQYGSGTYFSIGTITGVASNIITCPGHPLRSYDVVQPQTTGGGLTGGTNYMVRKWDSNTFSVYAYNNTEDATNIFDLQSAMNNDTRVAVTTGVSNMWWGYPHLPNSGVMKRTITNGFQWQGRVHDCMRVHWYRADGVLDYLAYGNYATTAANTPTVVSFWTRAATPNAVGCQVQCYQYVSGVVSATNYTLTKNWSNITIPFNLSQSGALHLYWFNVSCPAQSAWDIAEIQVYTGTSASRGYVASGATRSTTQALVDLTGNNTITANSLTYNSDNTFSFNGSTNYISTTNTGITHGTSDWTYSAWANWSALTSLGTLFENGSWGNCLLLRFENSGFSVYSMSQYWGFLSFTPTLNAWYNASFVRSGSNVYLYINGILTATINSFSANIVPSPSAIYIGMSQHSAGQCFNGKISNASIYTRALSQAEIQQNFNALRGKYGV